MSSDQVCFCDVQPGDMLVDIRRTIGSHGLLVIATRLSPDARLVGLLFHSYLKDYYTFDAHARVSSHLWELVRP